MQLFGHQEFLVVLPLSQVIISCTMYRPQGKQKGVPKMQLAIHHLCCAESVILFKSVKTLHSMTHVVQHLSLMFALLPRRQNFEDLGQAESIHGADYYSSP